jgi:hypothetical protein
LDIAGRQRRVGRMQKEMPTYKVLDEVQRISSTYIRGISTSHSSHAICLSRQQHASSITALRASPLSGEISSFGRPWPASSLAPRKCDVCFAAWRGDTRWPGEAEAHSTGSLDGFNPHMGAFSLSTLDPCSFPPTSQAILDSLNTTCCSSLELIASTVRRHPQH